jgi:hypothetical protein
MQKAAAAILAAIIVLVIIIAGSFAWYNLVGWKDFSGKTGDSMSWKPDGTANLSRLRFKDCIFTVTRRDGVVASKNVTAALNGMAVAYEGGTSMPSTLTLTRPLNAFSFTIPGFNDTATVSDPSSEPWCQSPVPACPGAAVTTLVGKWRTI